MSLNAVFPGSATFPKSYVKDLLSQSRPTLSDLSLQQARIWVSKGHKNKT